MIHVIFEIKFQLGPKNNENADSAVDISRRSEQGRLIALFSLSLGGKKNLLNALFCAANVGQCSQAVSKQSFAGMFTHRHF